MIEELYCNITRNTHQICKSANTRHGMDSVSHHTTTTTPTSTAITTAMATFNAAKRHRGIDSLAWQGCSCSRDSGPGTGVEVNPGTALKDLKLSIDMDLVRKAQSTEEDRQIRRREQNKIAAAKYRNRKRTSSDALNEEIGELQKANSALRSKLHRLEDRREYWIQAIRSNKQTCLKCDKCMDVTKYYTHVPYSVEDEQKNLCV
ncbi:uncharacterized protein LOC100376084 isoform X1 [Saccoglossus kowalevskii]|uniref:Protein fosB-like isoform X1 n=1 Tax=Saccoglossus kowalevskii TaxID=10224 RepID=A0ABM0H091_SACKO|nr:PREDICTED: protein fosB-like isoform X1 [Saccoglossus kowalevskii]